VYNNYTTNQKYLSSITAVHCNNIIIVINRFGDS